MPNQTAAQEEFEDLLAKNNADTGDRIHPEDRAEAAREARLRGNDEEDEEDEFRASQIDAAMRMPTMDRPASDIKLPPASFDSGRATGVKGVIADARHYEEARKSKWMNRVRAARRSVFGMDSLSNAGSKSESEHSGDDNDEENFLREWRESRRRELETLAKGGSIRNRRTSPSVRMYGRLEDVDAMGYLDAIEKVGRETTVVVFVYDHESDVSSIIETALLPLVRSQPAVRFVKVHYEDIEFDNAGVPAILAYRNQGDLFANLTGLIEMIPEDEDFDSDSLRKVFQKHGIL